MRLFLLSILVPSLFGQDRTVDLLRQLADAAGPSGFEEPVRSVMVSALRPFADSLRFDGMGSIPDLQCRVL